MKLRNVAPILATTFLQAEAYSPVFVSNPLRESQNQYVVTHRQQSLVQLDGLLLLAKLIGGSPHGTSEQPVSTHNSQYEPDVVLRIIDANSVKLQRRGVVSLALVKTPTAGAGNNFQYPECLTYSPSYKLRQLLPPNTNVRVKVIQSSSRSKPHVLVIVKDSSLLVNRELVRSGFARARWESSISRSDEEIGNLQRELESLQDQAQRQGLGIFTTCSSSPSSRVTAEFEDIEMTIETRHGDDGGQQVLQRRSTERQSPLSNPGDAKGCSDFQYYEEALRWYETYYSTFGDVAKLDSDHDGVPCQGLPHTPVRERYRMKLPVK